MPDSVPDHLVVDQSQDIIRLFQGFLPARAIYVVAKLGIADHLAGGSKTSDELAAATGADPGALYRIMRLLAGVGVFHEEAGRNFSLLPLGETLRSDIPNSVRDFIFLHHDLIYHSWSEIMTAVEGKGTGAQAVFGKPLFEYLKENPDKAAIFHSALDNRSRRETAAIMDAYDFSACGRIVDVGCGNGAFMSQIQSRNDGVSAILFDRPEVITSAKSGAGGPLRACEFIAGDFFESVPGGGDTYVLKQILHDWLDDDALRILKSCRAAMSSGTRLLVVEALIGAPNQFTFTHLLDMAMLGMTGGLERTKEEFGFLFEKAGFRLERAVETMAPPCVLEAVPV